MNLMKNACHSYLKRENVSVKKLSLLHPLKKIKTNCIFKVFHSINCMNIIYLLECELCEPAI